WMAPLLMGLLSPRRWTRQRRRWAGLHRSGRPAVEVAVRRNDLEQLQGADPRRSVRLHRLPRLDPDGLLAHRLEEEVAQDPENGRQSCVLEHLLPQGEAADRGELERIAIP